MDKISQLPDDILLKFISLLDWRNAVQTSVLAKRWRYLCTLLVDLDFDAGNMCGEDNFWELLSKKIGPEGYLCGVNQIIKAHQSLCVRKFRVLFPFLWDMGTGMSQEVEKWLRFAFSKRVEELELELYAYHGKPTFCMTFGILKQFPKDSNGVFNLKSLHMSRVDISAEALEYILLHSPLLERLCIVRSNSLRGALHIFSNKLKHLSVTYCEFLKELVIDALSLISFQHYLESLRAGTNIVFKRVPKLADVELRGKGFFHPFPILKLMSSSSVSSQLTKLSFYPEVGIPEVPVTYFDSFKRTLLFPNVKHLTVSFHGWTHPAIVLTKFLVDVCPMLHSLKLQVGIDTAFKVEAEVLQGIKLGDGKDDEVTNPPDGITGFLCLKESKSYSDPNHCYKNQCHSNLKALEIVGFRGGNTEVEFALDIIAAAAHSFETLICDDRDFEELGLCVICSSQLPNCTCTFKAAERRRVHKLAKLVAPGIHVGVRDAYSQVIWVS